jgi:hypothetical protein
MLPDLKVVMLPVDNVVMLPAWLPRRVVMLPAKVDVESVAIRMDALRTDDTRLIVFLLVNETFTGVWSGGGCLLWMLGPSTRPSIRATLHMSRVVPFSERTLPTS